MSPRPVSGDRSAATDERARLEAERDFLLASLDDLDAERAAGGIDEESYRALHDDYTARAATALRSLRDGFDARPARTRLSWRRRAMVVAGVVAFATGTGFALAYALGARLPGQTGSGNSQVATTSGGNTACARSRTDQLAAIVSEYPGDVATRLLLARLLECRGDLSGALAQYDGVLAVEPASAEALASSGRVLYLAAQAAAQQHQGDAAAALVDEARQRLDRAVALDAGYADAHFFRAIVLANEYQEWELAQSDLQRYLVLAPDGSFVTQARQLLADVATVLESPTTTLPATVPTTRKGT